METAYFCTLCKKYMGMVDPDNHEEGQEILTGWVCTECISAIEIGEDLSTPLLDKCTGCGCYHEVEELVDVFKPKILCFKCFWREASNRLGWRLPAILFFVSSAVVFLIVLVYDYLKWWLK